MKGILEAIRDFYNGWALDRINSIIISWVMVTIATAVSYGLYGNAYVSSALHNWSVFMDWLWILDTAFSVPAFVNAFIRIVTKFAQKLWEDIKDIFRG
jgi:hypothetical protein